MKLLVSKREEIINVRTVNWFKAKQKKVGLVALLLNDDK